jgi:hypothetical protein
MSENLRNNFIFKRGPVVKNELFEGIMGLSEYKEYQKLLTTKDRENMVLISITEPVGSTYLCPVDSPTRSPYLSEVSPIFTAGYHDVLETKFWDVETQVGNYKPITKDQGKVIKEFIEKNKDKKFLIHCRAGMSRSAAVGKAVECLVKFNGDVYEYRSSHSDIDDFVRYEYNPTVFDAICKNDEYKDCEDVE